MPLCETCRSIDFVQLAKLDSGVIKKLYKDKHSGLGIFFIKFEREIRTSTDFVLYHDRLEDLMASAQLCDLCRLILSPVETVLANRRTVGEDLYYHHDLASFQLWACGYKTSVEGEDGVSILGISKDRWTEAFLLCSMVFRVDEGKCNEHTKLRSSSAIYASYLSVGVR